METRAPYTLIGLFVLAVVAAGFGFVYWLNNAGGIGARTTYQVRFQDTVSGLLTGAAVLFNGIRVGEVTALDLDPRHPKQITVTIAVSPDTPIRADTRASLEFSGLTGVPVVTLFGGSPEAPPPAAAPGQVPMLIADTDAGYGWTESARQVLQRLNTVLADNAEPLKSAIANINTFSEALARNSKRIDSVLAGFEKLTGGGTTEPQTVYQLAAPKEFPPTEGPPKGQLVVPDPTAAIMFETRKIVVHPTASADPSFAAAQWADSTPKLWQAAIVESLENAKFLKAVGRPIDGINADHQLLIDIRDFEIDTAPRPTAKIQFAAKIVDNAGTVIDTRLFQASVAVSIVDAPTAAAALDKLFGETARDLVNWIKAAVSRS